MTEQQFAQSATEGLFSLLAVNNVLVALVLGVLVILAIAIWKVR